jgi:hypothetical protein
MTRLVGVQGGEIGGSRNPRYVSLAARPQCDSIPTITTAPPEVGGGDERGTGGGETAHEDILSSLAKTRLIGIQGGEIGGSRNPRYVSLAARPQCESPPVIATAPPEVGGGDERGAGGGEFAYEDIPSSAAKTCLVGVQGGEIGGFRNPRDVSLAARPQFDSIPAINTDPPEVGGGDERGAGGGEFAYEDILIPASTRLVGVRGGEIGGQRIPRDVSLAARPQCDSIPVIETAPPEVGGGDERGTGGGETAYEDISTSAVTRLVGVQGGEIGGQRIPRDISLAARPQCDSPPGIIIAPPEVGGIDERGAGGGETAHEGIISSAEIRLVGIQRGEIGGSRIPRYVSLAARPQCDSIPVIPTAPPEVGGIDERGAGGGEFAYEDIPTSAAKTCLVGIQVGKIGGDGFPCDISLAARPQCDSIPIIITAPPEVGGVFELKRCGMNQRGISG